MRQPQVFTTDVSVFGRHTSRGKPLVCDSESFSMFFTLTRGLFGILIHSDPVEEATSSVASPSLTGQGIAAMLLVVAGKHSIQVVDRFVSRSNPSPVAAGDGFSRKRG